MKPADTFDRTRSDFVVVRIPLSVQDSQFGLFLWRDRAGNVLVDQFAATVLFRIGPFAIVRRIAEERLDSLEIIRRQQDEGLVTVSIDHEHGFPMLFVDGLADFRGDFRRHVLILPHPGSKGDSSGDLLHCYFDIGWERDQVLLRCRVEGPKGLARAS